MPAPDIDPIELCCPWWLPVLRDAGYEVSRLPKDKQLPIRQALIARGIVVGRRALERLD